MHATADGKRHNDESIKSGKNHLGTWHKLLKKNKRLNINFNIINWPVSTGAEHAEMEIEPADSLNLTNLFCSYGNPNVFLLFPFQIIMKENFFRGFDFHNGRTVVLAG